MLGKRVIVDLGEVLNVNVNARDDLEVRDDHGKIHRVSSKWLHECIQTVVDIDAVVDKFEESSKSTGQSVDTLVVVDKVDELESFTEVVNVDSSAHDVNSVVVKHGIKIKAVKDKK